MNGGVKGLHTSTEHLRRSSDVGDVSTDSSKRISCRPLLELVLGSSSPFHTLSVTSNKVQEH